MKSEYSTTTLNPEIVRKLVYSPLIIFCFAVIASCNKAKDIPRVYYNNSQSYIQWSITRSTNDEVSPLMLAGWNFDTVYVAKRGMTNADMAPFFGYPVGTTDTQGRFNLQGENSKMLPQHMVMFCSSGLKIEKGQTVYPVISQSADNYIAKLCKEKFSTKLYMLPASASLTIEDWNDNVWLDDALPAGSYAVITGNFRIPVSASQNGDEQYLITGRFRLPVSMAINH